MSCLGSLSTHAGAGPYTPAAAGTPAPAEPREREGWPTGREPRVHLASQHGVLRV